jgi:hypothetical protein
MRPCTNLEGRKRNLQNMAVFDAAPVRHPEEMRHNLQMGIFDALLYNAQKEESLTCRRWEFLVRPVRRAEERERNLRKMGIFAASSWILVGCEGNNGSHGDPTCR